MQWRWQPAPRRRFEGAIFGSPKRTAAPRAAAGIPQRKLEPKYLFPAKTSLLRGQITAGHATPDLFGGAGQFCAQAGVLVWWELAARHFLDPERGEPIIGHA